MRKGRNRSEETEAGKTEEPTEEAAMEETAEVTVETTAEESVVEETNVALEVEEEVSGAIQEAPNQTAPNELSHPSKPKRFEIIIDEQDNWDKNNDVFCTDPSNGRQYSIKRGHLVIVPEGVVNNLRDCVIGHLEKDEYGEDRMRNIPRFAMRVIREVT